MKTCQHVSGDVQQLSAIPRLRSMKLPSHTLAQTIRSYDRIRHFVNTFAKRLFPWTMMSYPDHMALHASFHNGGRGIVFTAGDRQAGELLTVIPSLRQLGCKLPIEIMYLGDEDLDEDMRDRLEELDGVVTRDLRLMIDDDGWHLAGTLFSRVDSRHDCQLTSSKAGPQKHSQYCCHLSKKRFSSTQIPSSWSIPPHSLTTKAIAKQARFSSKTAMSLRSTNAHGSSLSSQLRYPQTSSKTECGAARVDTCKSRA